MYGVDEESVAMTPSDFEDLNKLIQSFHLNLEDSFEENELRFRSKRFTRIERNFSDYVKTPSEDSGVDSNNERVIRRKKKVSQQKERKRIKSVKENESNLMGHFDDDGVSLLQEQNENLIKSNLKSRKVTRKKLATKSDPNQENYMDDYQVR